MPATSNLHQLKHEDRKELTHGWKHQQRHAVGQESLLELEMQAQADQQNKKMPATSNLHQLKHEDRKELTHGWKHQQRHAVGQESLPESEMQAQAMTKKEISNLDLLLIGKTGTGKSATGNTILRRKAFVSSSSSISVTSEIAYDFSEFRGRVLKVVDGPGVGDTRMEITESIEFFLEAMQLAIVSNPRGYHAFLLVVAFGGRFTNEDKNTISLLKNTFGENFVHEFCILVLTRGDMFEIEAEAQTEAGNKDFTFDKWCTEQEGVLRELMAECNGRVLLFDNNTKDERKKYDQINKLIFMVDNLSHGGRRYTDDHFKQAEKARDRVFIESKKPKIQEETMATTSLILQNLQQIHDETMPEIKIPPLETLLERVKDLHETVVHEDKGTGALNDLLNVVYNVKVSVTEELRVCHRQCQDLKKMQEIEEDNRKRMEEDMQKQKEEVQRSCEEQWQLLKQDLERKRQEDEIQRQTEEEKWRKELGRMKEESRKQIEEEMHKQSEEVQRSSEKQRQQLNQEIERKRQEDEIRRQTEEEKWNRQMKHFEEERQRKEDKRQAEEEEWRRKQKTMEEETRKQIEKGTHMQKSIKEQNRKLNKDMEQKRKEDDKIWQRENKQMEEKYQQMKTKIEQERKEAEAKRKAEEEEWRRKQKLIEEECLRKENEIKAKRETDYQQIVNKFQKMLEEEAEKSRRKEAKREQKEKELLAEQKRREELLMKQMKDEQDRLQKEAKKEMDELKRKLQEQAEEDNRRRKREAEEAERKYQEAKQKNDEGFFSTVGKLFKMIAGKLVRVFTR